MATFGTSLITDCIFDFDDPDQLQDVGLEQRLELWGLQVWQRRHNHLRDSRSASTSVFCASMHLADMQPRNISSQESVRVALLPAEAAAAYGMVHSAGRGT
jgi:hypothetical protein